MAAKKYNIAIEDLDPVLREPIKGIIKRKGYTSYTIVRRNVNPVGGGFLGELIEIDVVGETVDGEKETNIFIKKRNNFEKIKLGSLEEFHLREVFLYVELAKVIKCMEAKANVPTEDRYKVVKAYEETNKDILIFENITRKGFKTYDRLYIPPLKFLELAVEEIAKFHAISFVIEHNMPDFYEKKIKSCDNPCNTFDDDFKGYMKNVFVNTAKLFDDEEKKKKVEQFLPVAIKKMPQYEKDQTSVRCCLTHGDYRMNNILVREVNGEPVEVIPIDYQLLHYGCPLKDFFFLVFSCTQRNFRAEHLDNLKELYFVTLSRYLKYFDMDVEAVYPRKEFNNVYKEWLDYGLIRSLFASLFLFAPENGVDVMTMALSELPFNPEKEFEESARGWIEDFIEWGYL